MPSDPPQQRPAALVKGFVFLDISALYVPKPYQTSHIEGLPSALLQVRNDVQSLFLSSAHLKKGDFVESCGPNRILSFMQGTI